MIRSVCAARTQRVPQRGVSSLQLAKRRQTLPPNAPELEATWKTWRQRVLPHAEALIQDLAATSRLTPTTAPDFGALASEFARDGAVCLPGLFTPAAMAASLEKVAELDDPYAVFWHPADEMGRNTHLGAQLLVDSPPLAYDPQPLLDRLAPGLRMPSQLGWWIAALPVPADLGDESPTDPSHSPAMRCKRWHVDGFEDKVWHTSQRVLITLVLAQSTPGPHYGATAFRAGSHRWVARYLQNRGVPVSSGELAEAFRSQELTRDHETRHLCGKVRLALCPIAQYF